MGKKSGEKAEKARVFVLKVAMHCSCDGCIDKIRAAVKDITSHQGIESWDQSALESKGELRLRATADPEKLRHRLHKATRKHVDLILPKDKDQQANSNKAGKDTAAAQALLNLNSLQAQQVHHQYGQNAWPGAGGVWNAHGGPYVPAAAYPSWAAPLQQPDPYAVYSGVYPAAGGAWGGAYSAYPPAQGAYGWHGHGY